MALIISAAAHWLAPALHAQEAQDYKTIPPLTQSNNTPPMVMLSMSLDHQLFFKAYNDFDDINGDGVADITYSKNIEYIGYFDSQKCYKYSAEMFSPDTDTTVDYYCNQSATDQWSGNFLNWVSMARIDIVRKILYGGLRSTDDTKYTVLERSHLPNDAHSFAKYYNSSDLSKLTPFNNYKTNSNSVDSGITFCNTTLDRTTDLVSQASKAHPLIRAVKGNYTFWSAGERWQCLYDNEYPSQGTPTADGDPSTLQSIGVYAHHGTPELSDKIADYIARIEVCASKSNLQREECFQYPEGSQKPIGILQKYGQNGEILFGLMSGSYAKNKSGGVLRKNMGSIGDEINVATNGVIKNMPSAGGIIKAINSFKIANWMYLPTIDPSTEKSGTYFSDNCMWSLLDFNDGQCTNWGNPFAEIMLESYRYLAGQKATANYNADDTFISPFLKTLTWHSPLTSKNYCSNLNLLALNSSTISYDGDSVDPSDIGLSFGGLNDLTNNLGQLEGIAGTQYFVGKTYGIAADELCTAKRVTALAAVRGTCPDAPRLRGSYYSSGLAFYAKTHDINPKIEGNQTVNTFGFSLAPPIPKVVLPRPNHPNKTITIFPACRNQDMNGNCAIVDFKILEAYNDDNKDGVYTGLMYVTWEDSEQGGDFDQDLNGIIAYELTEERLTIKTRILKKSTGAKMGFGFIVNGVNGVVELNGNKMSGSGGDGFHVLSGANGFNGGDCNNCDVEFRWNSKKFIVASGQAKFLEQPLYYASKYGGFKDINNNGIPDLVGEWDAKNNYTNEPIPDGIPDNYYNVNNPKQLKVQFDKVISQILASAASGAGSSVVTNSGDGAGIFLQSLFYPSLNYKGRELSWVSTLNGMFMDTYNNMREDSDQNGALSISDKIIDVVYDEPSKNMMAQRYNANTDGSRGNKIGNLVPLHDLKPVWSAHKQLATITDPETQRSYTDAAKNQRYIFTAIDANNDGLITQATEVKPFTAATFSGDNYYLLGLNDSTKNTAANIVNYIRGAEVAGFRSRAADLIETQDGLEVWRLGDIANATPAIVGAPKVSYDTEFADASYQAYRKKYQNRRTMVYAAANDGMIHAFNAGYFNAANTAYSTDKHPLGAELWAYAPYNLLPHLRWLTHFNYPHVAYIDGKLQTFDVNIFNDDADHPNGWGTILVAGMHFGGGAINVTSPAGTTKTLRSGWVVLDVTNPEKPPALVAEITDEQLGFTTTNADIVKFRQASSATGEYNKAQNNQWYLAFGSGPYGSNSAAARLAQTKAVSDQTAKIFLFDLINKSLTKYDTGVANAFVGGLRATDWNRDYQDDALYYGLVSGTDKLPAGSLRRGLLNFTSAAVTLKDSALLTSTTQAFSAPPFTRIDKDYNYWVFAGTGRFFNDLDGTYSAQNNFYGLKETLDNKGVITAQPIDTKALIDVTNIQTYTNGQVRTLTGSQVFLNTGDAVANKDEVTRIVAQNKGWFLKFPNIKARNVGSASMHLSSLLFTAFTPTDDLCSGDVGNTRLYQREFFNGLSPTYSAAIDKDKTLGAGDNIEYAIPETINLGDNYYLEPTDDGLTQSNAGELKNIDLGNPVIPNQRESWREINKDW